MKRQTSLTATLVCVAMPCLLIQTKLLAQPFQFGGPGVRPEHYQLTTYAEDLNYPVGMASLSDGSILVAVSNGSSFFGSSSGQLIRLVDNDGDGKSDERIVMADRVPGGGLTAVSVAGDLVFTTGQGKPISIYRFGDSLEAPLSLAGRINLNYPAGRWLHPHSALAVREAPSAPRSYELFFQLGSDTNFNKTARTVTLNSDIGVEGALAGDAVHRLTITDRGDTLLGSELTQIASGLRNAAGFAFDSQGNLYLQDNGIDGQTNANEPTSADELNLIRRSEIGTAVIDFGFPNNYTEYRTDKSIGGEGRQPVVSFVPLPEPASGAEAEGPNDIAFAPESFPLPLRGGIFVGMHGKFSRGGRANEENPVVFVDLRDQSYFHFIENDEASIGHLDGLLTTADSLLLADISPGGGLGADDSNTGVIYQLKSLIPTIDELTRAVNRGETDSRFDLDQNGVVDAGDRIAWIKDVNATYLGDANLDGKFSSTDLVQVFQTAKYEADAEALWKEGDWSGDQRFTSTDLVAAFQDGGFEQPPAVVANSIPEPSSLLLLCQCAFFIIVGRARLLPSRETYSARQEPRPPGCLALPVASPSHLRVAILGIKIKSTIKI